MNKQQRDRFDDPRNLYRVGAHRANYKIGSKRVWFLFAFLITLLLTAIGILFIQLQPGNVIYSDQVTSTEEKPVRVTAELDPEAEIVILNGTELSDLAYFVDDEITNNEWGVVIFSGNEEQRDVQTSAVFYGDKAAEGAAIALGEKLGGIKAYEGPEYLTFDNKLTVLLGADYNGPGLEEAKQGGHPLGSNVTQLTPNEFFDDEFYNDEFYEEEYF